MAHKMAVDVRLSTAVAGNLAPEMIVWRRIGGPSLRRLGAEHKGGEHAVDRVLGRRRSRRDLLAADCLAADPILEASGATAKPIWFFAGGDDREEIGHNPSTAPAGAVFGRLIRPG